MTAVAAAPEAPAWRLGHRPSLDAIRGLAVLLVLLGHFHVIGETAATIGVTPFFVLSGYLITALLLVEHGSHGRVDFRGFYMRRARRLLPALGLLLMAMGIAAALRGDLASWLPRTLPVVLYVSNWGYLAGVIPQELGHTWSLAIEEQFYLLWPAALAFMVRRGWPFVTVGTVVLALTSVVTILPWLGTFQIPYYGSTQRAIDLLAGALIAILAVRNGRDPRPWWPTVAISVAVVAGLMLMQEGSGEAGVLLLPLPLAVLVAWAAGHPQRFAWRPLTGTGRISYGLYLYHYPLIELAPAFILFPITYAIAIASWVLVESRVIRRRSRLAITATAELLGANRE